MKCMRCGEEMRNTIGGCYTCDNCGFGVDDLVLRCETKNGKTAKEANVIDTKDLVGTGVITNVTINGESYARGEVWDGTTNVETDEGLRNKIKDLEHQLAEKDKLIEEYKTEQLKFADKVIKLVDKKVAETLHQVCEEIREKSQLIDHYKDTEGVIHYTRMYLIQGITLDQIEQGEE